MINEPEKEEYQALARLSHNEDFVLFMGWIRRSQDTVRKKNDIAIEEFRLRQGQGSSQTLTKILDAAKDSVEKVKTFK